MKKILLILVIVLFAVQAWGADVNIYLDASWTGTEAGTEAQPYNSVKDLNWTTGGANSIYDIVNTDGDRPVLNFKGGETFSDGPASTFVFLNIQVSPIVVTSYGTGRAIIDATGYQKGIQADTQDSVDISNIEVKNAREDNLYIRTATNGTLTNIYTHHAGLGASSSVSGIYFSAGSDTWVLDNITSTYNGSATGEDASYAHGIYINASDGVTVKNSNLSYNGNIDGIDARGITFNNCSNGTIEDSTILYNGDDDEGSCVEGYIADNMTVQRNIMTNYKDGAEIKNDCDSLIFISNSVTAINGSGLMYGDADSDGVGESTGGTIANNTILFGGSGGIEITSPTQVIENNIIVNTGIGYTYTIYFRRISLEDIATITLDYNYYYQPNLNNKYLRDDVNSNNYTTIAAWQEVVAGHDGNSAIADPLLVQTWKLKEDSPALDEGVQITDINDGGELDIAGNAARNPPNIGAYYGYGMTGGGGNNMSLGAFGISGGFNIGGQGIGLYSPGWREGEAPPSPNVTMNGEAATMDGESVTMGAS